MRDDGTGAAAPDGAGHGLIGIRERVKLYGGEMAAGTPRTGGLRPQHPPPADRVPAMSIRVLVADDQSMVRAGFRMLLAGEEDIEVVAEASNGLEAVAKAARFHPTVVLMDIRMPELDGLEATRRILAADAGARILILTTFDLDEYVYEALRAGASGFVLKDDPPEQLIAAIRTVAAGDALLSPAVTKRVIEQFTRIPRPAPPKELDELTAREQEILRLIAGGLSNAEIGERALHQRDDGQDARHAHPPEARPARPRPGGRAGLPDGRRRRPGLTAPPLRGLHLQRGHHPPQRGLEVVGAGMVVDGAGAVGEQQTQLRKAARVQRLVGDQSLRHRLQGAPGAPHLGAADGNVELERPQGVNGVLDESADRVGEHGACPRPDQVVSADREAGARVRRRALGERAIELSCAHAYPHARGGPAALDDDAPGIALVGQHQCGHDHHLSSMSLSPV